jgi:hypothetical protein
MFKNRFSWFDIIMIFIMVEVFKFLFTWAKILTSD